MGADGAANIIFSKEIKNASDGASRRKEKIAEYQEAIDVYKRQIVIRLYEDVIIAYKISK